MQQLPNLTSLRFILAVLVILFHIPGFFLKRGITSSFDFPIFLNGNESVWLFFSLSGFLIIKQLNDEKKSTNTINLIRF
jgi:peptidoglycan/LPS O-acetylase OafA/YrhL